MAVSFPTPVQNYALGRDCVLDMLFLSPNNPNATKFTIGFRVCISEGSLALDTDTIEVPSNCQKGWKIKLPGLKSGTLSFTGYLAVSHEPTNIEEVQNILLFLGQFCQIALYHDKTLPNGDMSGKSAFTIEPSVPDKGTDQLANGLLKSCNVTVSPDDVMKVNMVVELTGAQTIGAFLAVAEQGIYN